jgi:putative PIN family toxin of toxin-antitoxin system
MNRKFVLDTSVLLKYTTHSKLYRLLNIVIRYKIIIYINDNLKAELQKNLPKVIKNPTVPYSEILEDILFLTTYFPTKDLFDKSPDPKDNFLFDLAIQSGSEVIVSDEKKLLAFQESPVPVRSLGWFKDTFPIDL